MNVKVAQLSEISELGRMDPEFLVYIHDYLEKAKQTEVILTEADLILIRANYSLLKNFKIHIDPKDVGKPVTDLAKKAVILKLRDEKEKVIKQFRKR